jgi:integrase
LDGQRRYEALKTTNKAAAIKTAHKIIHRIDEGKPNKPGRRQSLEKLIDQYLQNQRNQNLAPRTLQKYEWVLSLLKDWAMEKNKRWSNSFTEQDFWAFNQVMVNQDLSEKTRYDRLVIVKQLFKWSARNHLIAVNPLVGISMKKPESSVQPCFTPEQIAALLDKAHTHEGSIFGLMAYTGMRFGEVRDLRWTDLVLDQGSNGFIVVRRGGSSGSTKSKRTRRIPIHPNLREILDRLPRNFDRVFTARPSKKHPDGGGPIDERRLLMSLKRLCRRCAFVNPKQYKLHTFRHAFASMCARNNISYKYALEWMGHTSSEILDLYYKMYDATAEAAIKTIDYSNFKPNKGVPAA